jgi:hypothetical protein
MAPELPARPVEGADPSSMRSSRSRALNPLRRETPSDATRPMVPAQSAVIVSWTLNVPDMFPMTVLEFPMPIDWVPVRVHEKVPAR